MPNLPNCPDFVVEGWFTDTDRAVIYCLVTIPGKPGEERVTVTDLELAEFGEREDDDLAQVIMARVRDAVARLAGYHNYADMARQAKRMARTQPFTPPSEDKESC